MRKSQRAWALAFLYVGFIYATLNIVPVPLRYLRSHNVLRLTLVITYAFIVAGLLVRLIKTQQATWRRILWLTCILCLYPMAARLTSSPEELLHFAEYGLVGVLFARALQGGAHWTWPLLGKALVIGTAAGWIDELLQGCLPNRHYDVRDIFLNGLSVGLGLLVYAVYPLKPRP